MSSLEDSATPEGRARALREGLVGLTLASRYALRRLVGHGGMGAVYEAEHLGLGKSVAVKLVDPEFATEERIVSRFAREARAMSAIDSPHIVTVLDAGTENGRPFLVMELLRGEDLGQRLRRLDRLPVSEALHVVAQVLKGLAKAHAAGIVHRDLKPDNVFLLQKDGDPLFAKIVDFGVSKIERPRDKTAPLALTGRGTILGTPFYMSPEQAQAMPDIDVRADLYSVGAILFECLAGRPPHPGETYEQIVLSICMRDAPDLRSIDANIPAGVAIFVARALSRDRAKRPTSASRMLAELHAIAPEEKLRVPVDLEIEEPPLSDARVAAVTTPDAPLKGARTQLDGSRDAARPGAGAPPGAGAKPGAPPMPATLLSAGVNGPVAAQERAAPPVVVIDPPARARAPVASTGNESAPISAPAFSGRTKRSTLTIIVTAGLALITGVAVMVGLVTMLGGKSDASGAHRDPPASGSVHVLPPTITSGTTSAALSAAPQSTTALSPLESAPPSTPAPPTVKHAPKPRGGGAAAPGKKLDISRDLP